MQKDNEISPSDQHEFRCSVGPVTPLSTNQALVTGPRPRPIPLQSKLQHEELLYDMLHGSFDPSELETGEELFFSQPGLQTNVVRKLRRGQFSREARLDLHGMTVPIAKEALAHFLRACRLAGKRCVTIVHGKGNGSAQRRPVLKGKVNGWLQQRSEVLAFCSARPVDGGTGAVYVLLKRA